VKPVCPRPRIGEPAIFAAKVTLRDPAFAPAVACRIHAGGPALERHLVDLIEGSEFLSACAFCQSATESDNRSRADLRLHQLRIHGRR